MWKTAARAGLRRIGQMVQQGNLSGASSLAKTPGVLKTNVAGSQIRQLGQGSEGVATLVAHPEHGVSVRKLYDPRGISGQEMIARKEQAGRALGNNPHFAQFHGAAQTPYGGQMHFSEFIPQGQAPTGQAGARSVRHAKVQAQKGLTQAGFAGKDIRSGNMVYDARTNSHKVIDYIPSQNGEFIRMPERLSNVLASSPGSPSPWNPNFQAHQEATSGGMIRSLVGGRSTGARRVNQGPVSGVAPTVPALAEATNRTMLQAPSTRPGFGGNALAAPKMQPADVTRPLRPQTPTPPQAATRSLKPSVPPPTVPLGRR